jgi:hypothetical protein
LARRCADLVFRSQADRCGRSARLQSLAVHAPTPRSTRRGSGRMIEPRAKGNLNERAGDVPRVTLFDLSLCSLYVLIRGAQRNWLDR